ncbi:uncharacterized protein [Branchiostoma lanceolatum]|uniref:uncharacterized protein n=1 Tax=Branchiostoma lanceolatum TaxID=7740 RepID=UPI0034513553
MAMMNDALLLFNINIQPTTASPSPQPTTSPAFPPPEPCNVSSDLFFVLDGSGSVSISDFDAVKQFVVAVVGAFTIGLTDTRVGVLQYSSGVTLECNLGDHPDEASFVSAIGTMTRQGGGTRTGSALEFARRNAAWRPAPVPKIMIVLTDGKSSGSVVAPAQALAADQVTVFAIGVGSFDHSELLQITNNKPGRVFELADFNVLAESINRTVRALCSDIRLVGGSGDHEGRVEVFHNGQWGTICDDGWSLSNAEVACRQLGFSGDAGVATTKASFGEGSGRIWLDDVGCSGSETRLQNCSHSGWGSHDCGHHEDAGVVCNSKFEGSARLIGGSEDYDGRVEVYYNGQWGAICDDGWSLSAAEVACRQLDFPGAERATSEASFGRGTGPIWLDDVGCSGSESSLHTCSHRGWGSHDCAHSEDAGVVCNARVRLVDGSADHEGRVEVYHNGEWGTVCGESHDTWEQADAEVACRQLGFAGAKHVMNQAFFGQFFGRIWLGNVDCSGNESNIRLVGGSGQHEGRVEVYHDRKWGSVCDDGFGLNNADVACRQLGFPGAEAAPSSASFGEGTGPIWLDDHLFHLFDWLVGPVNTREGWRFTTTGSGGRFAAAGIGVEARRMWFAASLGSPVRNGQPTMPPSAKALDRFGRCLTAVELGQVCKGAESGHRSGKCVDMNTMLELSVSAVVIDGLDCNQIPNTLATVTVRRGLPPRVMGGGGDDSTDSDSIPIGTTARTTVVTTAATTHVQVPWTFQEEPTLPGDDDCAAYHASGQTTSGVYTLDLSSSSVEAYCDMDSEGGGWTVIQRRQDGSVPFNRTWEEYKQGFGNKSGEYWLGNENIHFLTKKKNYKLRIDLEDFSGNTKYAEYSTFRVSNEALGYRLHLPRSGYTGDAGNSMHYSNGQRFSTLDRDNDDEDYNYDDDDYDDHNSCSKRYGQGGWWFRWCDPYLNGRYLGNCGSSCPGGQGVMWDGWWDVYSLKSATMKIRP